MCALITRFIKGQISAGNELFVCPVGSEYLNVFILLSCMLGGPRNDSADICNYGRIPGEKLNVTITTSPSQLHVILRINNV
jgi:hypothetical protein